MAKDYGRGLLMDGGLRGMWQKMVKGMHKKCTDN